MGAAVELDDLAFPSRTQAALAMSGRASFAGWAEATGAQQAAQGFAAEREAFLFRELLAEMVVVEPGIGGAGQAQDAVSHAPGQTAKAGPPATGVSQRRCAALPIASFEAFDMARRNREQLRGAGTRQVSVHAISNHGHSLQFLSTQRECLHRVTFSRCC
jgi:hypothetical protein